jgi:hypothetical protein
MLRHKAIAEQIEFRQKRKILRAEAREQGNSSMRQIMKDFDAMRSPAHPSIYLSAYLLLSAC